MHVSLTNCKRKQGNIKGWERRGITESNRSGIEREKKEEKDNENPESNEAGSDISHQWQARLRLTVERQSQL